MSRRGFRLITSKLQNSHLRNPDDGGSLKLNVAIADPCIPRQRITALFHGGVSQKVIFKLMLNNAKTPLGLQYKNMGERYRGLSAEQTKGKLLIQTTIRCLIDYL